MNTDPQVRHPRSRCRQHRCSNVFRDKVRDQAACSNEASILLSSHSLCSCDCGCEGKGRNLAVVAVGSASTRDGATLNNGVRRSPSCPGSAGPVELLTTPWSWMRWTCTGRFRVVLAALGTAGEYPRRAHASQHDVITSTTELLGSSRHQSKRCKTRHPRTAHSRTPTEATEAGGVQHLL